MRKRRASAAVRWVAVPCIRSAAVAGVAIAVTSCVGETAPPPLTLDGLTFETLFVLGAEEGASHETFEGIWDIEVDADGRLGVMDIALPAIHVYDAAGEHIGSIDATGLDEGQIDRPSGIVWAAPGELTVWDPGSSWVSRFDVGTSSIDFVERWRAFAFGETGYCAWENQAFLSYYQDGLIVHEIGPEGVVGSFGSAPAVLGAESLGPDLLDIAIEELTPSALLCTEQGVLDVGFIENAVRLHDYDGQEIWSGTFDAMRPIVAYSDDFIGLGRAFDEADGSHLLRSVVPWGPGYALVQHEVRRQEIPEEGEPEIIESRLIDLTDGSELARSRTLPLILAVSADRVYLVEQEPYPRLTVARVY